MLATLTYPAAGVGPYSIHALPYLSTAHLTAAVDGAPVAATFDDAAKTATLAAAPAPGTTVTFVRSTPRTEAGRLVDFLALADGAAGLTEALLDTDYRQLLYILQEGRDHSLSADDEEGIGLDDGHWDAEGLRLEALAAGSSSADAITVAQLTTVDTTVRNLPASVLDNDDGLFVVGGEWDDLAPAGARTALGLGSAALLVAGTGANNAAQFDSSARYPTADGRNIDVTSHPLVALRARATVVRMAKLVQASPGVDPSVATWSQGSSTRISLAGAAWTGRVELNNSGDVDGSVANNGMVLAAGTWRIRWTWKVLMPTLLSATNATSLRLTNNDNTASQVVYFDAGLHRPSVDFLDNDYSVFADSALVTLSAPTGLVFHYTNKASGGNNFCDLFVLFHRIA